MSKPKPKPKAKPEPEATKSPPVTVTIGIGRVVAGGEFCCEHPPGSDAWMEAFMAGVRIVVIQAVAMATDPALADAEPDTDSDEPAVSIH